MTKSLRLAIGFFSFLFLFGCDDYGKELSFNGVQLFYQDGITDAEASQVGNYLIESGFADGETKSVQLIKSGNTYQFRMVVKKGIEQDQDYAMIFKQFARELSDNVFNGAPVDLHACDDQLETLRVYPMATDLEVVE